MQTTDADQPAHPRSLISIFIVRSLDSIIFVLPKLQAQASFEAEQPGLRLTRSETPKTGFIETWLNLYFSLFLFQLSTFLDSLFYDSINSHKEFLAQISGIFRTEPRSSKGSCYIKSIFQSFSRFRLSVRFVRSMNVTPIDMNQTPK